MKSRQLCFYIDLVDLPQVISAIENHIVPHYAVLPHFLGLTAIKANVGRRAEVVVTSFWDDGLGGSEEESARFITEIVEVTGRNPSRKSYDTMYAQVRDSSGSFRVAGAPEPSP